VLLERTNTPAIEIPNIHGEDDELHLSLIRFTDSINLIASEGLKPLEPYIEGAKPACPSQTTVKAKSSMQCKMESREDANEMQYNKNPGKHLRGIFPAVGDSEWAMLFHNLE
jgi:hypothetical protein